MTSAVFNHPWLAGLFGDAELDALLSAEAQLTHMLAFEIALTQALAATGRLPVASANAVQATIAGFIPDWDALRAGTARDGVVVPSLVAQIRAVSSHPDAVHVGATSQDVIDTSLSLTLRAASEVLAVRLARLGSLLETLKARFGAREMMGRTRMQAALPIPAGHRIAGWRVPLERAQADLDQITQQATPLSLGGAVGTGHGFGGAHTEVAAHMAQALGLPNPERVPHTDRGGLVAYGDLLSRISGALGKLGQDVALMAQQGVADVRLSGGGTSSAMAHKQNPVLAELLVTLARFNATQVSGLHGALVHEQERSGSAWALEWMILPQMLMATGRGLTAGCELIAQIEDLAP